MRKTHLLFFKSLRLPLFTVVVVGNYREFIARETAAQVAFHVGHKLTGIGDALQRHHVKGYEVAVFIIEESMHLHHTIMLGCILHHLMLQTA